MASVAAAVRVTALAVVAWHWSKPPTLMQSTLALNSAETGGGGGGPCTTTTWVVFASATQGANGQPVEGFDTASWTA